MTTEPSKMSGYSSRSVSFASTCWIRRLHCWSQGRGRPMVSFQAGSLIARRRALARGGRDRPQWGVGAQRHRQRLEDDPLDVVLRLGLGQAEAVDLDAVAEAQHLLVADAVALAAELVPERSHRAQLGDLLDQPDAGVDEEGDAAEDLGEVLLGDLAARLHLVVHGDTRGVGVGE